MRIPTAEIIVNGKRKIVNADDPRVTDAKEQTLPQEQGRQEAVKRGRPRKKAE